MKRRYPLAGLHTLRRNAVERHAAELERRRSEACVAERLLAGARGASAAERERQDEVRGVERERLEQGAARSADLSWAEAFEVGARARAERLAELEARAAERVTATRGAERAAQTGLSSAHADEQVLLGHRQRFELAEARREELAEEEAAQDRAAPPKRAG